MSSSNSPQNSDPIIRSSLWSIRTLFLSIMVSGTLLMGSLLFWAALNIMDSIIHDFGTEILAEKLSSLIHPVDVRYATLKRIGLEDSQVHHQEIKEEALNDFAQFRYKQSGEVFVIGQDRSIQLSRDFTNPADKGFAEFYDQLSSEKGVIEYLSENTPQLAVFRFYKPWKSYIGITVQQEELHTLKGVFINISLLVLAAVLLSTLLFTSIIQRIIITPLVRLAYFASKVSKGNYDSSLPGNYILELGILKTDMLQMVSTLRQKMNQTVSQLEIIKEREVRLDNALAALRESEEKYRTIYNAPTEAIFILDPEDGKILDANKATLQMFGYNSEKLQTMTFSDLSSEESPYTPQEADQRIQAALEKGSQFFEWLAQKRNGEYFWVEISLQSVDMGGLQKIVGVIRNVHTRKMTEHELASEKERLSVTLRSIGDGVITTDIRGRIILMNNVAENLTGWRQVEAVGRVFSDVFHIVHQETGEQCENPASKILSSGQKVELADDTILIGKDGSRKNIADSGAPITGQNGQTIGTVIVFRDITEDKRMEEELFKIKKLESVGVLAGGIAHDFNNILVAILGNVSLARQRLDDRNLADSLLQNTEKAALRAKDLTSQLLTFSRGGEPVLETASLNSLIRESAEFILRGSNIKLTFDIPVDLWFVKIDSGQISQVVQNIVLNARQAMAEEGQINITCRNCENCDSGAESLNKRCVRVVITDNGIGIPEEVLPQIFDPYFSTKDDGSGLGLSICHSILKKHGAMISVESTSGEGTVFTIQLPVSEQQKLELHHAKPEKEKITTKARIMVMDDDPMIVELSKQMLEHLGHEVVTTGDGEQTLELYAKALEENIPFDIVIMDLTIPGGMGGKKTIKELLRIDPDARAIVSSGYSNDPVMAEYRNYGFKSVIVKPYQVEDLAKAVQDTLQSETAVGQQT